MAKLLLGKTAIITGASNGIGLATIKAFLAAGCSVLGVDRVNAPSITDLNFKFSQVNLVDKDAARSIVDASIKAFGPRIDVLVNVAGVMDNNCGVDTLVDEDWERVMAVDLTGPVRLMREVSRIMKEQKGGSIVNVSSKAGSSGAAAGVAYTASKHGLVGVTKNTAWLLKDYGIRCNAICPGAVQTNISANTDMSKWDMSSFMKMKPIIDVHVNNESIATPDVPADVLLFLASDLSRGVNGAIIPVDNAWSVI